MSDVDGDSEDLAEPAAPAEGSSDGDNYYHGYSKEEVAEELEASYAALNARVWWEGDTLMVEIDGAADVDSEVQ